MESDNTMATAKSVISTIGSVAAAAMVTRTIVKNFVPPEITEYLFSSIRTFFSHHFSSQMSFTINEFNGFESNQLFEAAEVYLGSLTKSSSSSSSSVLSLRIHKPESEESLQVAIDKDEEIVDNFKGAKFTWVLHCYREEPTRMNSSMRSMAGPEIRAYYLAFHKKHKDLALDKYFSFVLERARLLEQENKTLKLFTVDDFENLDGSSPAYIWSSINLNHPATFETLALDPELKNMIMKDLDRFVDRKECYRRVGKARKRGYLLYGPPGTGKSSLIAAVANHLNFDIFDLQLAGVKRDSDLRKILIGTGNRSILVVEDIDCSVEFKERDSEPDGKSEGDSNKDNHSQMTLSGLLNFIDGLWSSCGDERIIIFTTNYKDKLDSALLRPGRMDMHIHMSYCTTSGFRVLAKNYLGLSSHELFEEIEGLIEEARVTPAEVAEWLMRLDEPSLALRGLVDFIRVKVRENGLIKDGAFNGGALEE